MRRGVDPALVARPTVVDFGRVIVGRSRTATVGGRKVLANRRSKGRARLSA